jgi:hypothetical protein
MAVFLEWVETGRVFPLARGRPVVIGRGRHAEIHLDIPTVSRWHCDVHWDGCRVCVDEQTCIGTYINGKRFQGGHHLRLGDILRLGPVPLRLSTSSRVEAAWRTWHGGLVVSMAQRIYDCRDFTEMPVLADALEEAGCTDADILGHCRSGGEHVRGCWVVDLLLGKE